MKDKTNLPRRVVAFTMLRGLVLVIDGAWTIATTWAIVSLYGPAYVGVFTAALSGIMIMLMTPASRWAEKYGPWKTLLGADAISVAVLSSCALVMIMGGHQVISMVVADLLLAMTASAYMPASGAYLQLLSPPDRLTSAMGLRSVSTGAGSIGGSVIGGLLVASLSYPEIALLAACGSALSLLGIWIIGQVAYQPNSADGVSEGNASPGLLISLKELSRDPLIRWCLARAVIVNVLGMALTGVILISRIEEQGYSSKLLGLLEGTLAGGSLIAGALLAKTATPSRPGWFASLGFVICACAALLEVLLINTKLSIACAFVLGFCLVFASSLGDAIILSRIDKRRLMFMNAVMSTVSTIAVPLGQGVAGIFMQVSQGFYVALSVGGVLIISCTVFLFIPRLNNADIKTAEMPNSSNQPA